MLFISHDLAIVEHMTPPRRGDVSRQDRRAGAEARAVRRAASIPIREALLSAVPVPEPGAARQRIILQGRRAEPDQPADGLPLPHPLPLRLRPLPDEEPPLRPDREAGHLAACHLHDLPAAQNPLAIAKGAALIAA